MTGADLLVRCLADHGIDTVFALPGEETADLMDALDRSSLDVVLCRHEQAAAFMASVHGRLTGRPAVCLATLGPGATNLLTGVADATLDFAPLIAVTGQGARDRVGRGQDSHQILDLERLFEPVTKASRMIWAAPEIPGAVAEAVALSQAPRPGAVHLSLPEDLAGMEVEGSPQTLPQVHPAQAPDDATHEAAAQIAKAQRPILLAGAGILRGKANSALAVLLEATGMP
ncbi:MAG: thiamine pyrophosphate-binding protein, partial [Roseobacter sp.]|nr:thiamine pyrophosphate-binding protein [Roseobacter sp.]